MSVIGSTVIMATLVVGPFYLIDGLQMTPAQAGLALSVGPVISAVGGVPIGRLVDRLGIVAMSLAGLAIMAAGAAGLAFSEGIVGLPRFIGSLIVVMGGYGVFQISNNAAVMAKSSSATRGTFAGLMNLSRNIGLVTGASVMASIFSATAHGTNGELPIVLDAAHGLKTTFAVAAGLATLAVAIGLSSGAIPLFRRCANRGG
jgi:MFS family permease